MVNLYPWATDSDTEALVVLSLPVVLWFAVAYPYMGGTVRSRERRMDFVRFTGEWFIYYGDRTRGWRAHGSIAGFGPARSMSIGLPRGYCLRERRVP